MCGPMIVIASVRCMLCSRQCICSSLGQSVDHSSTKSRCNAMRSRSCPAGSSRLVNCILCWSCCKYVCGLLAAVVVPVVEGVIGVSLVNAFIAVSGD